MCNVDPTFSLFELLPGCAFPSVGIVGSFHLSTYHTTSHVHPTSPAGLRRQCPKSVEAAFLPRVADPALQHGSEAARPVFRDVEWGRWALCRLPCFTIGSAHGLEKVILARKVMPNMNHINPMFPFVSQHAKHNSRYNFRKRTTDTNLEYLDMLYFEHFF